MEQLDIYNTTGGYNPYKLSWGEEIQFPSTRKLSEYGNRIYNRYPARSIFLVPRAILFQHKGKNLNILDPFMGSGTTAVETIMSGNIPYGAEMDEFARNVAEVSTTIFEESDFRAISKNFDKIMSTWRDYEASGIPELFGIERWFNKDDFDKLLSLRNTIISTTPKKYLKFMMIVYADCIKPISKMERQSTKPYISSKYEKKTKPVDVSFNYSFKVHYEILLEMAKAKKYQPSTNIEWLSFDATSINIDEPIIDIAITSPPYINAFDYTQCIKVESALCGYLDDNKIKALRSKQVGHSNRKKQIIESCVESIFKEYYDKILIKDKATAITCKAYFNDIYKNLSCVYNSLKKDGEYHIIIGNSVIKGVEIPTHEIIAKLAKEKGYKWFGYYKYLIKDHRTSIPRDKDTSKIKYEHVIMLKK